MDLTLSPSNRKAQSNKLAVFSSIENRSDILEGRKLALIKDEMNTEINKETKRYAVTQNMKDCFYAIHHIQKSQTSPSSENNTKKSTTPVRGRKRITPEQQLEENSPPPIDNKQRKKSRQQTTKRKSLTSSTTELPSLYQTCHHLWPESSNSLGEYSHDNIQNISNLLKVRLCQAKFKLLATLDRDDELFSFLSEECISPKPKSPYTIKFSGKQSKSSLSLVGNGKNLFKRHPIVNYEQVVKTPKELTSSPTKPKERKKKTPRTNANKTTTKKNTTPKRKSAAADVTPIVQSDGTSVYVCIPCNKKYKNRNGLAYHLERCKYTAKREEEASSQNGDNIINCICTQNTDEHGTMVQCDKCRIWLHSECVGLTEDNLDDVFHCQSCKTTPNDLLQSLLEAQQSPSDREEVSSQNIHDIFSQTTKNDDTQSDDEEDHEIPSSNQLHVWDDFSFTEQLDQQKSNEPWSMLDEENEPFSSYDNDIPSSSWTMNDINLFSQPPSLLFSEATLSSALDEDMNAVPLIGDLDQPLPLTEATPINETSTPHCDTPVSNTNTPVHTADGLWFQFANFDDDYQCET